MHQNHHKSVGGGGLERAYSNADYKPYPQKIGFHWSGIWPCSPGDSDVEGSCKLNRNIILPLCGDTEEGQPAREGGVLSEKWSPGMNIGGACRLSFQIASASYYN